MTETPNLKNRRRAVRVVQVLAALLIVGAGAFWAYRGRTAGTDTFRTVAIERTDVRRTVSATGRIDAEQTVEVGTQVSGILAEVLVDFNDKVTQGQVLARIDTALLDADVASASAKVAEATANRDRLALEAKRVSTLRTREAATDQEAEVAAALLPGSGDCLQDVGPVGAQLLQVTACLE